jgi:hypothetical protein
MKALMPDVLVEQDSASWIDQEAFARLLMRRR